MSKKSFNEIEQIIKNAVDSHETAFDEAAWVQMEALLNKEKDRKRPFVFWLWMLLPLMIGGGLISYFTFTGDGNSRNITVQKNNIPELNNNTGVTVQENIIPGEPVLVTQEKEDTDKGKFITPVSDKKKKPSPVAGSKAFQNEDENPVSKSKLSDKVNAKMKAGITSAIAETDNDIQTEINNGSVKPDGKVPGMQISENQEEVIVVHADIDKMDDQTIEKIIDSLVEKPVKDKVSRNRQYRFYFIAAAGVEASGVKLFSTDKFTGRVGLAAGYQLNENLSVQAGFFTSNKKYEAAGSDYKTKPGSYWNSVDIKKIEANCRVYEIPVTIRYDFTPGKKLNIFASAGLSSYIMKKEDYQFYYERYGSPHQADVKYSGNKNLFSVLRVSAGVEKKISNRIAAFVSPGIAVPLSGVGEGEVKLYSTDIILGLKFSALRKK